MFLRLLPPWQKRKTKTCTCYLILVIAELYLFCSYLWLFQQIQKKIHLMPSTIMTDNLQCIKYASKEASQKSLWKEVFASYLSLCKSPIKIQKYTIKSAVFSCLTNSLLYLTVCVPFKHDCLIYNLFNPQLNYFFTTVCD